MKIYRSDEDNEFETSINEKGVVAPNLNDYASGYQQVYNSIGDIENMSNINIAQSVAYSFDIEKNAHNDKN